MRISDWSSDVCSSDLSELAIIRAWPRPASLETNSATTAPITDRVMATFMPEKTDGAACGRPIIQNSLSRGVRSTRDSMIRSRSTVVSRSDERRVGNECISTCRYRRSQYHAKKKQMQSRRYKDSTILKHHKIAI